MKLKQKRIRGTKKLLSNVEQNSSFLLGVNICSEIRDILTTKLNISETKMGTQLFPSPLLGIMSERNSIGEYIPEKDKPKETAYRAQDWELEDWGGYSHSGTSYVPYERYPRKFIEPKELKLKILKSESDDSLIVIDKIYYKNESEVKDILFGTNLLLEIFREVDTFILDEKNIIISTPIIETVNWEIIPKGERIWDAFKNDVANSVSNSEQKLMMERFEFIKQYKPDSVRQGVGGYTGYLVFEFRKQNIYIFDSIIYGDATYIFENDWEYVSKLTKKQIITNNLARARIIHNKKWKNNIRHYLPNNI